MVTAWREQDQELNFIYCGEATGEARNTCETKAGHGLSAMDMGGELWRRRGPPRPPQHPVRAHRFARREESVPRGLMGYWQLAPVENLTRWYQVAAPWKHHDVERPRGQRLPDVIGRISSECSSRSGWCCTWTVSKPRLRPQLAAWSSNLPIRSKLRRRFRLIGRVPFRTIAAGPLEEGVPTLRTATG